MDENDLVQIKILRITNDRVDFEATLNGERIPGLSSSAEEGATINIEVSPSLSKAPGATP